MSEIYIFRVHRADARVEDGKMTVRLWYPRNPEPIDKRLPGNLSFGVQVFGNLKRNGYSTIADEDNPIKPPGGGSIYVLEDGKLVCHRRDKFAPTHKLYHSGYGGFPSSKDAVYTAEGIIETALRESAEECLLVTRDKSIKDGRPWLVVPNDSREYTTESARTLGLELKPRYVDVEVVDPTDRLEVYDEDGNQIFTINAFLKFIYESETSIDALQIRRFPLSSDEVLPIDAEGMMKDGKFMHYNREAYILDPSEVGEFGSILENPEVYQTRIENGAPVLYRPKYAEPYLGPDLVEVTNPHVFAPEDQLVRHLDALGIDGYKGKWMEIELWKEESKLEGRGLLPENVLSKARKNPDLPM